MCLIVAVKELIFWLPQNNARQSQEKSQNSNFAQQHEGRIHHDAMH